MLRGIGLSALLLAGWAPAQSPIPDAELDRFIADLIVGLEEGSSRNRHGAWGSSDGDLCAKTLVKIGKPAVPRLIEGLKSKNGWVRVHCGESLGALRAREGIEPLLAAIEAEKEKGVKSQLIEAYAGAAGKEALNLLVRFAAEPDFAHAAIRGLGKLKDPAAIPTLARHLGDKIHSNSGRESLSYAASDALAALGPAAFQPLKRALFSKDDDVVAAAAYGLCLLKDSRVTELILSSMEVSRLRKALLPQLASRKDPALLPLLLELLASPNLDEKRHAAWALGKLEDPKTALALCDELARTAALRSKGKDDYDTAYSQLLIIDELALTLDKLDYRAAVPYLIQALELQTGREDIDHRSKEKLIFTLRDLGGAKKAEKLLISIALGTKHDDEYGPYSDAEAAAVCCGEIGYPAVQALAEAYRAGKIDAEVYGAALSSLDDPRCLPYLEEAALSGDKELEASSLWGLGQLGDPSSEKVLKGLMMVPDLAKRAAQQLLRRGVADGLAFMIAEREDLPYDPREFKEGVAALSREDLSKACSSSLPNLSLLAAKAMLRVDREEGVRTLGRLAATGEWFVAVLAAAELQKLKAKEAREPLLAAFRRSEIRVRIAAFEALQALPE